MACRQPVLYRQWQNKQVQFLNEAQQEFLVENDCDIVQGYLISAHP
jgi:hypothetical protein